MVRHILDIFVRHMFRHILHTFFDILLSIFNITIPKHILYCYFLTIDKKYLDGENNIFVYFLKSEKELNKE